MKVRTGVMKDFFGVDDDFERVLLPRHWVSDIAIAVILTIVSVTGMMTYHLDPSLEEFAPLGQGLASTLSAGVLIALRRRFPIWAMALTTGVHFVAFGIWVPLISAMPSMQVLYFLALYTAMAYARQRDALMVTTIAVLVTMLAWLVIAHAYRQSLTGVGDAALGAWYYAYTAAINVAYFGVALFLGRGAWLQAKASAELRLSQEVVRRQSAQLADRAVLAERLRIARDLHDSVAHHISLIGVQTAAARRAMETQPELAERAMRETEEMSRDAVGELRGILGSLRDIDASPEGRDTLTSLTQLTEESSTGGLRVLHDVVGDPALAAGLTPTQTGTLLRVAQEALTNVRRHSTADEARVVLRLAADAVELEITDNGRPVPGTTGSGLGQVGMRERVTALAGTLSVGPRVGDGYRVHVVLPRSPR